MQEEFLDIIDHENNIIGQEEKQIAHANGLPHRVSVIFLQNPDGKYLIPTASNLKDEAGGLFHSAAGHVKAGQTYLEAASEELHQETGILLEQKDFKLLGMYWFNREYPGKKVKERFEIYLAKYNPEMGRIILNEEQINEQWLTKEELMNIYKNTPQKLSAPLKQSLELSLI
jgi:isopentenyldiphosphate isomerase